MRNDKKLLMFDCFGVVIQEISLLWFADNLSPAQMQEFNNTSLSADVDLGTISQEEFFESLAQISGVSANKILADWYELAKPQLGVLDLVDEYSRDCNVCLLSNSPTEMVRHILKMNDLEKHFDEIIISSEVGYIKPAPEIYKIGLGKFNANPSKTIMIDDREENLVAPRELGMSGVLFKSAEDLASRLENWYKK